MLQDNVAYTRVDGDMNARVEALSVWDSAGYTRWSERFDVALSGIIRQREPSVDFLKECQM